jgi:hypothetical protein
MQKENTDFNEEPAWKLTQKDKARMIQMFHQLFQVN